jgi:hypothetical protein
MHSVSVISAQAVDLTQWERWLANVMDLVWIEHSLSLARSEGHFEGKQNLIGVNHSGQVATVLDRPTMRLEYEDEELAKLEKQVPGVQSFIAIDYSDVSILKVILRTIAANDCSGSLWLESEWNERCPLKDWPSIIK